MSSDDGEHQAQASFEFPVAPAGAAIAVRTDKAVYEVGDIMEVTVISAPQGATVLLDVAREGQTTAMEAGLLDELPMSFSVPVASGWDGELLITVTALTDGAPPLQARRTAFVHRHKELSVAVSTDKELYAPADTLKIQFDVTDEAGNPRQTAIGLTIVDEALFAIQDVKPGLLWRFFEAGNHLAEPVWKHEFPKLDVMSLLGQALPDPGDALEHFQFLAAAALAAVESLDLSTATASGGADEQATAIGASQGLVQKQMNEMASMALDNWSTGHWPADQVVPRLEGTKWIDPWGNVYEVDGDYDWVRFDSAGMDEEWGTPDDSITQWRVTGLANAVSGHLGTAIHGVTVFQDFFVDPALPVSYTRNDEVTFPVAVYNYLDKEQEVSVSLKAEPWYIALGPMQQSITMPANTVDAVHFSIRLTKAGWHTLTVEALGPDVQDAIARKVEVEPGGRPCTLNQSGATGSGDNGTLVVPDDTIEGSPGAVLKLYGTGMVHVLEGVDSLLHYPDG